MGLYRHYLFPWALERVMTQRKFRPLRREVLAPVRGRILEIGFGTGVNLHHYPGHVRELIGVDSNPGVASRARRRAAEAGIEVEHHPLSAESLPFADATFDWVVSTFTLCSIPDVQAALAEARRVLKPGGGLVFLEHGLSPDAEVARWQRRLEPFWKPLADGCHLTRNAAAEVEAAGFALAQVRNQYLEHAPRVAGYLYLGLARRGD